MERALAIVTGGLFAAGIYLMLRRSAVKLVIGLMLLSHAANLLIFTTGGLARHRPPIVADDPARAAEPTANPLPQAFILTAIVIGLGLQAFALALVYRMVREVGSDDIDLLVTSDAPPSAGGGSGGA